MFLRGRLPESTVWPRFRAAGDTFAVRRERGVVDAVVTAPASRAVDLFLALIDELPPAVDVYVDDARTGSRWSGTDLALPDVSEAMARLKLPLTIYGGAEISIATEDEQVSLTPLLRLHCLARNDRWVFLLRGLGLVERPGIAPRSWRLRRGQFPPAQELTTALSTLADRLKLGST
ncbi:MAG: hypothetical protein U0163_02800 [Gemmatimonadaceae bacterium]